LGERRIRDLKRFFFTPLVTFRPAWASWGGRPCYRGPCVLACARVMGLLVFFFPFLFSLSSGAGTSLLWALRLRAYWNRGFFGLTFRFPKTAVSFVFLPGVGFLRLLQDLSNGLFAHAEGGSWVVPDICGLNPKPTVAGLFTRSFVTAGGDSEDSLFGELSGMHYKKNHPPF